MKNPDVGDEVLVTARLELRRPNTHDIDLIWVVHSDVRACVHNPSDMLSKPTDANDLYARWDEHWQHHGFGYWVVHRQHRAIGFCGIKVATLINHDVLNLFYRLTPTTWGQGYASEAATAVVAWADAHRQHVPVIARVRPTNLASQQVAVNAGLRRAEHLDVEGEDGLDWIYERRW